MCGGRFGPCARSWARWRTRPGCRSSAVTWSTIATAEARYADAEAFERPGAGPVRAGVPGGGGRRDDRAVHPGADRTASRSIARTRELFERSGLLLTPTVGCEAFDGALAAPPTVPDWGAFLFDANLAGLPACAVPLGRGDDGLPISLQITGPRGADGAVLAAAEHIEELLNVARYV